MLEPDRSVVVLNPSKKQTKNIPRFQLVSTKRDDKVGINQLKPLVSVHQKRSQPQSTWFAAQSTKVRTIQLGSINSSPPATAEIGVFHGTVFSQRDRKNEIADG